MCKFYITVLFVLLNTKNIFSQFLFYQNGIANNIEYKDNKITIFYNDNFQCSNIGINSCYGIYSLSSQYQMSEPFYSSNNSPISTISGVYKTNNIEVVRGFSSSNDSLVNPYICVTRDTFTSCYLDDGKPTLGSSYMDDNNEMHYVGYVGSKVGICSNLPAHRLRYIKTSTQVYNDVYNDNYLTGYIPDSLLQFYDIEIYTNNINGYEYFDGFQTLILPTADQQSLILYSSPVNDTINNYYHPSSFSLLKLDADLITTYTQNLFSEHYTDSTYLDIYFIKNKKINNKLYIEGDAARRKYGYWDSSFRFLLELDTNGILLNDYRFSNQYNLIDSIENLNKDFEIFTTDTTTTINYYNTQRDIIRTITFPEKLNHNFVKTNQNKYLFVNYQETDFGYVAYLNVYNEHARKLKKEIIASDFWMDPGYISNAFLGVDTFQNVMFFFHQPTYTGGAACSSTFQRIQTGFQNLDYMNYVSGKITQEIIQNCLKDTLEPPAKNILVEMQLNGRVFFTTSDYAGNYRFAPKDTGHAKIILHLANQNIFSDACQDTFHVVLSDTLQNPVVNFLLHAPVCNKPVPKVRVDITTPFLRRCFDNIYTLTLFNESADTAFNTYADITLDEDLIPVDTAFLSAQNLGNNTFRFSFGDLLPLQTIRQQLVVNVNCDDATPGETHCVKAVSYPYERCLITDGKYMQAQAICRNDSVIFTIRNTGIPENFSQNYRVLVNDSVKYAGTISFTVIAPVATLSYFNPEGKTYRLETRQYPMYENEDTILSVAVEGCSNSGFATGYITMFAQDDDQPNVSIDCHQNVGSYDPNDKSASPVGYGTAHLVENTETIEYIIRFQNLGTFLASYVTIIDTLSADFDITTLKVTGASHSYELSIIDSNILKFYFFDINLVDAATDSLLSNGFIKFSIQPKSNTAIGNRLKNNAFIIFDYNDAVETNTVQHEIGKDFLKVNIISVIKNNRFNDINVKVYPNPASKQLTFELNKQVPENLTLTVYTIDGKEIYKRSNLSLQTIIHTDKWAANMYLFELKNQTELLQSGKIIIE